MTLESRPLHESELKTSLKRMRGFATGLLIGMAVLYLVAGSLTVHYPFFAVIVAFSEAALVGALADWFGRGRTVQEAIGPAHSSHGDHPEEQREIRQESGPVYPRAVLIP